MLYKSHLLLLELWDLVDMVDGYCFMGPSRGANDASRVRVRPSSSRVVNISSRARARVELTRAELDSTR